MHEVCTGMRPKDEAWLQHGLECNMQPCEGWLTMIVGYPILVDAHPWLLLHGYLSFEDLRCSRGYIVQKP